MYNQKMRELGAKRSVIRELFEYGKKRATEVGADKVYDFSLGNPSVAAPECVREALKELIEIPDSTLVHGYTSAQGDPATRSAIAEYINERFGVGITAGNIYMTCGAAASLTITLTALRENGDEIIAFAPYFPEYKVFIEGAGMNIVTVPFISSSFMPDLKAFENAITERTKAVIINSPNNPSGVVYGEDVIRSICSIMGAKEKQFGRPIYAIADEPYREIVYGGIKVPYLMNYYNNTVVCYSYSKSLSLPGERIGYIAVAPGCEDSEGLVAAVAGAGRALGYVCAPSTFQKVVARCVRATGNVEEYKKNRDLLYNALSEIGFECVRPDGAFYLFVKALEADANAFADRAKRLGLLIVPGDDFAAKGYVRLAYCVSYDMIARSLPAFRELYTSYK